MIAVLTGPLFEDVPFRTLISEMCSPQICYIQDLTLNVTVFRDGASKKVLKVKPGHKGEALI